MTFVGANGSIAMEIENSHYAFEDFIETTSRVRSRQHLFEIFQETMAIYGFDQLNFSIKYDDEIPENDRGFGLINSYPENWRNYYAERNLARIDPVWRCATSTFRPFRWRELERGIRLQPDQVKVLRLAEDAGLHNGLGIPFKGPRTQIAGVALATSTRHAPRLKKFDLISAFCHQFYESYKRLVRKAPDAPPIMTTLSTREREVLVWVASGSRDGNIAEKLNVSSETVSFHLRNIYVKLAVNNRVAAVVAGITLGLISL